MNTLGTLVAWGGLQITLLAAVGAVVYLLTRRRGPAAGSLVAWASLLVVLAVTVLVVTPWPRWYRAGSGRPAIAASVVAPTDGDRVNRELASLPSDRAAIGEGRTETASTISDSTRAEQAGDARATAAAFWQSFLAELRPAPVAVQEPARRWPLVVLGVVAFAVALGVGRLAIGLVAVRRLRGSCSAIADEALLRRVAVLGRELGCRRNVDVRESAEIATPATVGWRRPLVILPGGWREWSEPQRDAVLAHEVAHVQRGDYASAILAQLCLAVHFYHPLIHWLARRLRLEQELAADALGATLAGGREQYLRSLAALALQQDNRRLAWSARPFLPSPGTLLRRIEMLRDRKQQLHGSLSRAWRIGLVVILVAAGLGIAGLRGPSGEQAGVVRAAPPDEKPSLDAASKTFSLDYVPANANFVVAIRPQEIARHEAFKPLLQLAHSMLRSRIAADQLDEIHLVTCKTPGFVGGYDELIIYRLIKPVDVNEQVANFVKQPIVTNDGIVHSKDGADSSRACIVPDARTFVVGSLRTLRQFQRQDRGQGPRWADRWKVVAGNPIAVALDVNAIRGDVERELSPSPSMTPWVKLATPLWEQTDIVVAGVRLGDKVSLHATAVCESAEGAEKVQKTTESLLTLASNMLESMRADSAAAPAGTPAAELAAMKPLFDIGEKLFKSFKFTRAEEVVEARAEIPVDSAAIAALLSPALAASRTAAQPTQSQNNMKQIALALHDYATKHDSRFPPAVVMGPDGTTPHSWRVEILPHLEERSARVLYEEYKLDEPWDSENNRKVLAKMPAVFHDPAEDAKSTNASYFAVTGDATVFSSKDGIKLTDITDGTANTIMIVEAKRDVPWTKPEDIAYDPAKPLPKFGGYRQEGFLAALCDGSVRLIDKGIAEKVLRALLTKAGGEVTDGRDIPH